jgi:predicted peptidase
MRLLVCAIFALLVPVGTSSADTGFLDRAITINGETFRYQIYIPLEWSTSEKWPVIVALHGNLTQGSDGMKHTAASGLGREIRANRDRVPAIVIWPQAREGTWWATSRMQDLVLATIDDAITQLSGDPRRVYLVGQSMGGNGVLRIASRWPHRFAALAASAAPVTRPAPSNIADPDEDRRVHPI